MCICRCICTYTYIHIHMMSLLLYCAPAGRVHPKCFSRPLPRAILEGPSWKTADVLVDEASANIDILLSKMLPQGLLEDSMSLFAEIGMFPYLAVRACLPRWRWSLSAVLRFHILCVTLVRIPFVYSKLRPLRRLSPPRFFSHLFPSLSLPLSRSLSLSLPCAARRRRADWLADCVADWAGWLADWLLA